MSCFFWRVSAKRGSLLCELSSLSFLDERCYIRIENCYVIRFSYIFLWCLYFIMKIICWINRCYFIFEKWSYLGVGFLLILWDFSFGISYLGMWIEYFRKWISGNFDEKNGWKCFYIIYYDLYIGEILRF